MSSSAGQKLEHASTNLGERPARRGIAAAVSVVSDATLALARDASRVNCDVDASFLPTASSGKRPYQSLTSCRVSSIRASLQTSSRHRACHVCRP